MSSVDPKSLCNLARIDTSNDSDWSDLEGSLGSSHYSQRRSNKHDIEVIPSTPNGGYLADDEVASLREMDSLVAPSSTESIEEPFASLVISITNLEGTTHQAAEEWETTLQDTATTTSSTTDAFETHSNTTGATNNTTSVAANNNKTSSLKKNHTVSKPSIRPRVSAFDKENLTTQIPLRRCIGHRRVSFNNLPSPKDIEDMQEQGVEMSFTTATSTTTTRKSTIKQPRPKKKWTHRRPKVLNATTAFR